VFSSLAYIDRRLGRIPETIANFRRAIELDPVGVRIRDEFANTLLSTRHYDECFAFARGVLPKHPDDLALANTAALAELAVHGSTEAIKVFVGRKVATADQPEFVYLRQGLARVTGDWAEAIRIDREQRYFDGDVDTPRWMQDVLAAATLGEAGDLAGARNRAAEAVAVMNAELARQPDSPYLWSSLALGRALAGDHDGAVQAAAKTKALLPVEKDAVQGATVAALAASALAWAGEKDRALAEFAHLLHLPFSCNAVLDRGMYMASWKPLRDDPRFQALLNDPKNNEPLN
jgi:predicted Zn-dependent protease